MSTNIKVKGEKPVGFAELTLNSNMESIKQLTINEF
jgi:hypothetical protein